MIRDLVLVLVCLAVLVWIAFAAMPAGWLR